MRLSNKILLGFFGFIFLYLTAAIAEVRFTGIPNIVNDKNSIAETVDISGVSYLVVNGIDKHVSVIGSDRAELEVRSLSGNLLAKLTYRISGDTLTLSDLQSEDFESIRISVYVPKASLKGITLANAKASVRGLLPAQLNIVQASGSISMMDSRITAMNVDMSLSHLDISETKIDTLSGRMEKSEVNIYSPLGVVQGDIKDGTLLRLTDIGEIQLKKDESSRLMIYQ
ncbi:MAG TPA: hypothetical protein VD927_06575 [Chryseosolibacter sp.]|nr:hypothetical protein [Chryseosolibacter sp.]